jgi:hypothetical protein
MCLDHGLFPVTRVKPAFSQTRIAAEFFSWGGPKKDIASRLGEGKAHHFTNGLGAKSLPPLLWHELDVAYQTNQAPRHPPVAQLAALFQGRKLFNPHRHLRPLEVPADDHHAAGEKQVVLVLHCIILVA